MNTSLETIIEEVHVTAAKILQQGYQTNPNKHFKKKSVRSRIDALLDDDAFFLEIGLFAGHELYEKPLPAAGLIVGIGMIKKQYCLLIANDPNTLAGTYHPITVKKHLRGLRIAMANRLPCIYLVDSGGAYLPEQKDIFPDRDHFGAIFHLQAKLSSRNIPQIAVVLGECTAGGAYIPAMSDQCIMVKDQARIHLGGPALVKAATGECVDSETLGGATVHSESSGLADYVAHDEDHALSLARSCIEQIPCPLYDKLPTHTYVNTNQLQADHKLCQASMYDIIHSIIDADTFHEFKQAYGQSIICAFCKIANMPVGIIANNGILLSQSALKGTHFIQLCAQRSIPLIFLQNITGFMVGQEYEANGIAKHGAMMVKAVANCNLPKITVMVGASYGAGNYAMCGRAFEPDFLWSWPHAKIAIMGGQQAADVLAQLYINKKKRHGEVCHQNEQEKHRHHITQQYEMESKAIFSSARLWDDGIIAPNQTRQVLILSLLILSKRTTQQAEYGLFRM